ncbi:MAG TPA: TonB-dependent receptor [Tahibacter sp.]|nr:TonB-dependent receptor [Tahibacter sp.]
MRVAKNRGESRVWYRNGLAAAVMLVLGAQAGAVEAEADQAGQGEKATSQLEAVTVTAQRREEDVQKVPISITTIEPEKLQNIGAAGADVRALAGRLPSLNIESSFGRTFPRFYIRGLGNADFDLNASQPVSLIYDDVVLENPILKGYPIFDIDHVEMLRGPQGTLFGRNTPAGVVKFDSVRPSPDAEGYARINYGRYGTANLEAAAGGGLSDSVSARAAILYQHRDNWVDNTFAGAKNRELEGYNEFAGRAQLLYGGDDFEALFNLHARNLNGTARMFRANIIQPGTNNLVAGFKPDQIAIDGYNSQHLEGWGGSARLKWDFGSVSLFSITGYETVEVYSRGDIDGGYGAVFAPPSGPGVIAFPSESADGLPDHGQFTQEFRLQSNDWGRFDWQAGLYYFDESITIDSFSYDTLAGGAQNGYAQQKQDNTAWAAYASGEYDLTDALKLRGGLRYTRDEKDFRAERFSSPVGGQPIGPLYANPSASDVSGDLSLAYAASENTNLFVRVARGFRAPSVQGRILFGDTLSVAKEETLTSFEAGVKADLFDRRARLGFTIFDYTVHDQQLTAVGGAANFNQLINADRSKGRGFEVDFEAYLAENFLVTAGGSYNDTEIDDATLAIQPCGAPCTVLDPAGPVTGTVRIDGNPLPQAPKWIGNLTARYSIPVDNGEWYVFTDWTYRGSVNFFLYESKEFKGKALTEGGLRVGYNWDNARYDLSVYGRNITNQIRVVGGIDFNNLTGFINDPRVWGVEFAVRY